MITISRSLARQFKTIIGKAFGSPRGTTGLPVVMRHDGRRLVVRFQKANHALEYAVPDTGAAETLHLPMELFVDCQGGKSEPVTLTRRDDGTLVAEWRDHGLPQARSYTLLDAQSAAEFPAEPAQWNAAGEELLPALAAAADTCDPDSARYALGCLQLRGTRGEIVATDGRQVLRQAGFKLGFQEEILIPSSKLFSHREWQGQPASLAKLENHLVLRVGNWTCWLPIEKDRHFPRIDDVIPSANQATTRVALATTDLHFLAESVARLPANESTNAPVTVDLNGSIAIRARSEDGQQATELVLSNSSRQGDEVRFATNRKFLQRAAALGLPELCVFGPKSPVLCHDARRSYVWALLAPEEVLKPSDDVVRVSSAIAGGTAPTGAASYQHLKPLPLPPPPQVDVEARQPMRSLPAPASPSGPTGLEQALALRGATRFVLQQLNALVRQLQHEQRQRRLVQASLRSLKRLQRQAVA